MNMFKWFVLAFQFCTVLRLPFTCAVSESDMRRSAAFFPLTGLVLGTLLWGIQWALSQRIPALPAAIIALAFYTLATGALHLDGWMDTADALGSRKPREEALAIMKDSRVGAMGAIAGIFVVVGKVAALSALPSSVPAPFLLVPCLSRLGMVWAMCLVPGAGSSGGLGAMFARKLSPWVVVAASGITFFSACFFLSVVSVLIVLMIMFAVVVVFAYFMLRRFGGMTGDTYGALNELLEWLGWTLFLYYLR